MTRTCKSRVLSPVFEVGSPSERKEDQQHVQVCGSKVNTDHNQKKKTTEANAQEEKTTALTLAKSPTRLRPYPLKRRQAALGAVAKILPGSTSASSESLCWRWVGKVRLSAMVETRPGASSSPVFDCFSERGREVMDGRSGERLPQQRFH